MSNLLKVLLRGTTLLWTLLITALIGNVIASNVNAAGSAESAINFTMFVAVLSWLACIYGLLAIFMPSLAMPAFLIPLDGLVALFALVAGIVLAAKLRAVNCGNIANSNLPHNWIGYGSHDDEKRCREIQASTVFMWFLWVSVSGVLFFTIKEARSGLGGSGFGGSSVRSSRPAMSQISSAV